MRHEGKTILMESRDLFGNVMYEVTFHYGTSSKTTLLLSDFEVEDLIETYYLFGKDCQEITIEE